jgi:uncharacterized protein (UPF0371 family)
MWLLTGHFFAIASPDAFYQLRDACTSIRENGASIVLDNLEIAASTNSILRRYYLTRLVDYRTEEKFITKMSDLSKRYGL